MNDLVQTVSQKTGVPAETVQKVVQQVAEFLKGKVPAAFAGYIDQYLLGQPGATPTGAEGLSAAVGGLFGGGNKG